MKSTGTVHLPRPQRPGGDTFATRARNAPEKSLLATRLPKVRDKPRQPQVACQVRHIGGIVTVLLVGVLLGACSSSPPKSRPNTRPISTTSTSINSSSSVPAPVKSSSAPITAPVIPDLFVYTATIPPPGELFVWPGFPTMIEMDDNDWISGITWSANPQMALGSGTFYTNLSCSGPAAGCPPTAEGTVKFHATSPKTCTVHFFDQSTGVQQSEQALVFDHLQYAVTSGSMIGKIYTFSSPCSRASQPPGRCRTSALKVQPFALAGGGAAGSLGGAIGLTNHGSITCTLFGYPGMQLLGTDGHPLPGEPLPTTVIRGQYEVVDAVPEQTVTLAPGAQARFYYMYSDTLGGGSPAVCPTASAIDITPPGAYNQLTVVTDIAPCEGRIWVSPVTASMPFPLVAGSP